MLQRCFSAHHRFAAPLAAVALVLLLACAPAQSQDSAPVTDKAFLQNWQQDQGSSKINFFFRYVDGEKLPEGMRMLDPIRGNSIRHEIEPGSRVLGVEIEYLRNFYANPFSGRTPARFRIFVNDEGGFHENSKMTELERAIFGARSGLKINAEKGHSYRINCRFDDGRVFVWIEEYGGERDGMIVSEVVAGLREGGDDWRTWTDFQPHSKN